MICSVFWNSELDLESHQLEDTCRVAICLFNRGGNDKGNHCWGRKPLTNKLHKYIVSLFIRSVNWNITALDLLRVFLFSICPRFPRCYFFSSHFSGFVVIKLSLSTFTLEGSRCKSMLLHKTQDALISALLFYLILLCAQDDRRIKGKVAVHGFVSW